MSARLDHDHELDGALHDGCAMCELIRERRGEWTTRDKPADALAERYRKMAERAPRRRGREA